MVKEVHYYKVNGTWTITLMYGLLDTTSKQLGRFKKASEVRDFLMGMYPDAILLRGVDQ